MSTTAIPSVVTVLKTVTKASASATATSAVKVTPQGGILEGSNPSVYDSKNPLYLFIIQVRQPEGLETSVPRGVAPVCQDPFEYAEGGSPSYLVERQIVAIELEEDIAGIIIIFCRLLHWPLSKLRQPRVIAEVLGGIILGPSVMMRIPGFQAAIFPAAAMPNLNLVANIGLVLFLFLVGLEVNMSMFLKNWRVALAVGLAGMILPFGLGCAIAWGLYNQFHHEPGTVQISFPIYMLFIGTALAITAFPVLCRILTELKLLYTPVGVTVLAAGVGNDVTGWVLLALCVALVNNGSGITALYVLLTCVGWILFLVFAVRPAFRWILLRNMAIQNGPSQGMVALTILLMLTSAWFTGVIGVHPIFGAFLFGLICPHDGGFAIHVTEKIEDLVATLFLPLYFAYSGLSTNLGLLNDGITWAYVVGVIAIAFSGKIIGGTLAAKACKLVWRESFTIGVLMSCKGLVELIVLNIGLQAKILSTKTFTIFVVMALVTTVSTTPLTTFLYPPWYQRKLEAWKRGEIDWDGNQLNPRSPDSPPEQSVEKLQTLQVRRLLVYLRLDSLPSLFTFIALLGGERPPAMAKTHRSKLELSTVLESESTITSSSASVPKRPLEVHGLRMLELTDRTSSVMKVSEMEDYSYKDPVVNAFRTFAQLNNVAVSGDVSVVPEAFYAETLTGQASDHFSDLILIPWNENGTVTDGEMELTDDRFSSVIQDGFIRKTLENATCNIAIFVNRGFGGSTVPEPRALSRTMSGLSLRSHREREPPVQPIVDRSHHVFFPFFGGVDDRVALRFVLQLAQNSNITVTIVHFVIPIVSHSKESKSPEVSAEASRVQNGRESGSQLAMSERVDTGALYAGAARDTALLHSLRDSLPAALKNRVVFVEIPTTSPVTECLAFSRQEIAQSPKNAGDLIVVGRGLHAPISTIEVEFPSNSAGAEMRKTLGIVGESIISGGVRGSVLVIQAGGRGLDN